MKSLNHSMLPLNWLQYCILSTLLLIQTSSGLIRYRYLSNLAALSFENSETFCRTVQELCKSFRVLKDVFKLLFYIGPFSSQHLTLRPFQTFGTHGGIVCEDPYGKPPSKTHLKLCYQVKFLADSVVPNYMLPTNNPENRPLSDFNQITVYHEYNSDTDKILWIIMEDRDLAPKSSELRQVLYENQYQPSSGSSCAISRRLNASICDLSLKGIVTTLSRCESSLRKNVGNSRD